MPQPRHNILKNKETHLWHAACFMESTMNSSTYIALSAQSALQQQMAVVANNVANASTPGFKAQNMIFAEYLAKNSQAEPVSFVQTLGAVRNDGQGSLAWTRNALDLAVQGEGYFKVSTPNGISYTRNGQFHLDTQGQIVTSQGYTVLGQGDAPITIPRDSGSIEIASDGSISTLQGQAGRLAVVTFDNPQNLVPSAGGLYVTDDNPTPAKQATVVQGAIENANVNPIIEMTRLLEVSRNYTSAQNLIDSENQRITNAIDQLGKVA